MNMEPMKNGMNEYCESSCIQSTDEWTSGEGGRKKESGRLERFNFVGRRRTVSCMTVSVA